MRGISGFLRRLRGDARGAIGVLGALVLVSVIGVSALALEYGHALLARSENQRVADLAAYGGALVYNSSGDSSADAQSAATNIAALNGISGNGVTVTPTVVGSPTGDGNSAVEVAVTTHVPLLLARVLTTDTTIPVTATSYAEVNANAPGCIIALSGSGSGITMDGGTQVNADNCAVASDNSVGLSGGAKLVTQYVDYAATAPSVSGGASITPPAGKTLHQTKVTTPDPLAGNSAVAAATAHIGLSNSGSCTGTSGTVCAINSPSAPSISIPSGSAVSFTTSSVTGLPSACSNTYNSKTSAYTVTCSGTANFGAITVKKVTVTINTTVGNTYNFSAALPSGVTLGGSGGTYGFGAGLSTSGTTTLPAGNYNVAGSINLAGTTTFGAGTYNVTGAIIAGGGSATTFGSGAFNLGAASCSGTNGYSICNTGTSLTFTGPDIFVLVGGVYNGGGASLALGSGSTANSYDLGEASDGNSLNAGTSKLMTLGDANGSDDFFQTAGTISTGGGSCLTIPAAAAHDINGNLNTAGGVVLGSGVYTINGYVAVGNGGGGDVSNCPISGTTTGLTALDATLVVSGISTVTCGSTTSAFCLGAGYSTVDLTAPTSGATANLAVIGPQSSTNIAAAAFTTGATNTRISGAFYFPHGAVTMSGAAALADTVDSSACLELIGSQVTLGGGSAAASTCTGLGGGSSGGTTVSLVK